nr:MerR family transcriptional regulator [Bartonella vinsonii]
MGKAAQVWGVSISTFRRWESEAKIVSEQTAGGRRRYDLSKLRPELFHSRELSQRKTIAYAR